MALPAISARNISVTFTRRGASSRFRRRHEEPDAVHALRDVSFEVRNGEAFGIIGPNGAGKSTLMRVIGQTLVPDTGGVTVRGATSTLLQLGVGFNPSLDGSRNIVLGLLAAGLSMAQIEGLHDDIWAYSELGDAIHRPLSTYSRGMQSRLAFAIATYIDAEILLVDEVLAVGDESFKQKSLATMRQLLEDAGTIVMVSHALGTVQEFCDRVMWLENGAVQQIGDPAAVVGAYRDRHTLGNVRLVRATRSEIDQEARPIEVRRPEPLDVDTIRAARAGDPAPAYRDLDRPVPARAAPRKSRKLLDRGWRFAKGHWVRLEPPILWPDDDGSDRYRDLMAWEPIGILLMANDRTPDPRWVQTAATVAIDWITSHPTIDTSTAWDPEVASLRAGRLAALVDLLARDPLSSDADLGELTVLARQHAWLLDDETRTTDDDAIALLEIGAALSLARGIPELPDIGRLEQHARGRLRSIIADGQAEDGIWTRHTPSYQATVVERLTALIDTDLTEAEKVTKARNKAERSLAWLVMPDGTLPGFGEATSFQASQWLAGSAKPSLGRIKRRWRTGPMRAAASASRGGSPPDDVTRCFRDGGYVVLRDRWPDRPLADDTSYVAMMTGRHSTAGKHADDLSIVWFDRGRHLLVDAGGYHGRDEDHRAYVTAARAHNTIEIDGVDQFPGSPIGSGATHAGTLDDLRYGAARAPFGDDLITRRAVVLDPGRWLLVVDLLRDRSKRPHTFRQWWHPAAEFTATTDGALVRLAAGDVTVHAASLTGAAPVGPVRGAVDPRQGWLSPSDGVIEPAWAFGWETETALGGFATLFSFIGTPTEVDATLDGAHAASLSFRVGDEFVALDLDHRDDPPLRRR
jgi:ABC-type polysaccharide/polyol phosphate transport system ATPase subunit